MKISISLQRIFKIIKEHERTQRLNLKFEYQKLLHQKSDMRLKAGTPALAETESKSKVWLSKFDIVGSDKIHACYFLSM